MGVDSLLANKRPSKLFKEMKRLAPLLLASWLILLGPSPGMGQPYLKVGAMVPFSGRWGEQGKECAKGILDATKWINQRGGIYGRPLEIVLVNDTREVADMMAAFRKLNESDQIFLLYLHSLETALNLLPHIQHHRIPTVVSALPVSLTVPAKYPYLFTFTPTPCDLAKVAMRFVAERSGIPSKNPKVIFLGYPDTLGRHFLDETKAFAKERGIHFGPDLWIPSRQHPPDRPSADGFTSLLGPLLSAIVEYAPDFVYLSLSPQEAFLVLSEAGKHQTKTTWLCSARTFDETLSTFEGVMGVQPISPFGEDVPGMASLYEAHQKWHPLDSHTLSYVEGWATVQVISEVLGRALPEQSLSRHRVRNALEELKGFLTGGLLPPITITQNDHRPALESRIMRIKDGKIVRHTGFLSVTK